VEDQSETATTDKKQTKGKGKTCKLGGNPSLQENKNVEEQLPLTITLPKVSLA